MEDIKKIEELEKKLDELNLVSESKDRVTEKNNWKPRELDKLNKKARSKPEYILVQYLRNNRTMEFKLSKVISGNIIVIDNKGHEIDSRDTWIHKKYIWYIIFESDTKPITPIRQLRANQLIKLQRSTNNHPILMKMVLGAVEKKEEIKAKKNLIWWILGIGAAALIFWLIVGGK